MASRKLSTMLFLILTSMLLSARLELPIGSLHAQRPGLYHNFYIKLCPNAESLVKDTMIYHYKLDPTIAASLLRMQFHDCFVQGCDASVLLATTDPSLPSERLAGPNFNSLKGFDVIDSIKANLESECPGIVSCADVITLAARDAVTLTGGPVFEVLTGRRDSRSSSAELANRDIPTPDANITILRQAFRERGLDATDLVALLGAHTIGNVQCQFIARRLYNFSGTGKADPRLNHNTIQQLTRACPLDHGGGSNDTELDQRSGKVFDAHYYKNLQRGQGLLGVDDALTKGVRESHVVAQFARDRQRFFRNFVHSLNKLSSLGILTGLDGEIRRNCSVPNDEANWN